MSPATIGPRIVVLVSGTGSNLRALQAATETGRLPANLCAVGSDRPEAGGLCWAASQGIPTFSVPFGSASDRTAFDEALTEAVLGYEPDWIVLAGFMRLLGAAFVKRWPARIVNVHPSLLPAFPGMRGPAQAIRAGVRLAGCTVHLVDDEVDSGRILGQAAVPVFPSDDPATLHARIQAQEHRLLPHVMALLVTNRLLESLETAKPSAFLSVPSALDAH